MNRVFKKWKEETLETLQSMKTGINPKEIIHGISENLLTVYTGKPLLDKYDIYQHLMNYWAEVMQDDCYLIAADGWKAETYRILEENKKGKKIDKGWTCDLVPKQLVIDRYFAEDQQGIETLNGELESLQSEMTELEEEHSSEEGAFAELEKVNKGNINARLKEIKSDPEAVEEEKVLKQYLNLLSQETDKKKAVKDKEAQLDAKLLAHYPKLTKQQIRELVIDDKWLATIDRDIHTEMDRISQRLTQRIKELAERYETPMPQQTQEVADLEKTVQGHLEKMGFVWN